MLQNCLKITIINEQFSEMFIVSYHGAVASSRGFGRKFGVKEGVHGAQHEGIHVQMHHLKGEENGMREMNK